MTTARRRFGGKAPVESALARSPKALAAILLMAGVLAGFPAAVLVGFPAEAVPSPGTVTKVDNVTLAPAVASLATGKRIEYISTDPAGGRIGTSGLVLTPKTGNAHQVVAWDHGTTGLARKCAPSSNPDYFWGRATDAVLGLLSHGWTVAAPDYPGLGAPDPHPYLNGVSEAYATIDAVRAARNLDGSLSTRWAAYGFSQGGQAVIFAGEAGSYGSGLTLVGVAAVAPVSNLDVLGRFIPGTPGQGYLAMAISGLAALDPTVDPQAILAQPAWDLRQVLKTDCITGSPEDPQAPGILDTYAPLTAEQMIRDGDPDQAGVNLSPGLLAKFAATGNPGQVAPSTPILLVQGTADDTVPQFVTEGILLPQLCGYGTQPVALRLVENADHEGSLIQSVGDVTPWLADRFSALPAPSDC